MPILRHFGNRKTALRHGEILREVQSEVARESGDVLILLDWIPRVQYQDCPGTAKHPQGNLSLGVFCPD